VCEAKEELIIEKEEKKIEKGNRRPKNNRLKKNLIVDRRIPK